MPDPGNLDEAVSGVRDGKVGATDLTVRQTEVLRELIPTHCDDANDRWLRPQDIGGSNGSHHSATLAQLVRKGLAEDTGKSPHMERGSKRYRATELGIACHEVLFGRRRTKAEASAHFEALRAAARERRLQAADTSARNVPAREGSANASRAGTRDHSLAPTNAEPSGLCSDCPPVGSTDKTRCLPCPRHGSDANAEPSGKGDS